MTPVLAVLAKNTKSVADFNCIKKRAEALFLVVDYFMNIENGNHRKGNIR